MWSRNRSDEYPFGLSLFFEDRDIYLTYYIGYKKSRLNDKRNVKGFICYFPNKNGENTIFIHTLEISEKFRGYKLGSKLVNLVIDYAKKNNYKKIYLDDMTDIHGPNNIYYKLGFKYVDYENDSKMILEID